MAERWWHQARLIMRYYVAILEGQGDVWGVSIPDLPGCFGGGSTPEDAIADATSAAREWAEHQTARGVVVPAPRGIQEIMSDPDAEFDPAAGESLVMIPLELARVRANETGSTA
jgi:predicted RNase H-like HicB family nuclease